jgi:hypothetical protein
VPYLLGFGPEHSLVAVAVTPPAGRVTLTLRYDLPDPPDRQQTRQLTAHLAGMLRRQAGAAVLIGYGPGPLVTPVADAAREQLARERLALKDVLRVHEGRYWSYLCPDPACCPAEGVPFSPAATPAAQLLAASGWPAPADRQALAATLAPVTGSLEVAMREATRWAEREAARLTGIGGQRAWHARGLNAVQEAIRAYRSGGSLTTAGQFARLAVALTQLPVRDDAWARMDPGHRTAHRCLWADLTRGAQRGYVAAPASLLAFTCWQDGDGAMANIALDRALADTPGYSMASLLREALDAGLPPAAARPPMTPEEVAASYAGQDDGPGNADR